MEVSSEARSGLVRPESDFEGEARAVMTRICAAFRQVLSEARAGDRASDLIQSLRLDKTLAWHVIEIAQASEPLLVAEHVPGEEGVRIVIDAVRRCGASAKACDELRESAAAFRRLLAEHAGDRRTLEAMLSALGDRDSARARAHAAARKQAFRANSAVFGIQARTQFEIMVTAPTAGGDDGRLDLVSLRGWHCVSRLHPGASMIVCRSGPADPARDGAGGSIHGPLDAATAARCGAPIVADLSSSPLPEFRRGMSDRAGRSTCYVADGPIGRAGALDLALGEVSRGVRVAGGWSGLGRGQIGRLSAETAGSHATDREGSEAPGGNGDGAERQRADGDGRDRQGAGGQGADGYGADCERVELIARLYTPAEHLVLDWLIHRDLWDGLWSGGRPELEVISELHPMPPHPECPAGKTRLMTGAVASLVGPKELDQPLPESPRHLEMLRVAVSQISGATLEHFRAVRVRLAYPPVPATLVVGIRPPER